MLQMAGTMAGQTLLELTLNCSFPSVSYFPPPFSTNWFFLSVLFLMLFTISISLPFFFIFIFNFGVPVTNRFHFLLVIEDNGASCEIKWEQALMQVVTCDLKKGKSLCL